MKTVDEKTGRDDAGEPDANWWLFTIQEGKRGEKIRNDPPAGTVEVNPDVGGRRLLSYHTYLKLDTLLTAQVPSSLTPDERVFIITHQLFELVFKQILFDLRVIADTFSSLLNRDHETFAGLVGVGKPGGNDPAGEAFWRPAFTASSRVRHSCGAVMTAVMTYLATEDTFDNQEFGKGFRANLSPASGFQSAQLRLIQRAFGKSPLLDVRFFPADTYLKEYLGMTGEEVKTKGLDPESAGLVSVTDPLILREDALIASPPADSPLFPVAGLDDLAHEVLARVAALRMEGTDDEGGTCRVPVLAADEGSLAAMEETFREGLKGVLMRIKRRNNQALDLTSDEAEMIGKRAAVFGKDWARALKRENSRREGFDKACRGAGLLAGKCGEGFLHTILDHLADADDRLSGGFLRFHRNVVERRIGDVPGTAGGGIPFLDFSRTLNDNFPALIAFRAARHL